MELPAKPAKEAIKDTEEIPTCLINHDAAEFVWNSSNAAENAKPSSILRDASQFYCEVVTSKITERK